MKRSPRYHPADQRNLLIAIALSAVLIVVWQVFVESPKRQELAKWHQQQQKRERVLTEQAKAQAAADPAQALLLREERLRQSPRVAVRSRTLEGSVALTGLRFDDLKLIRYRVAPEPDSAHVTLLSPAGSADADPYFMQVGWLSAPGDGVRTPDEHSRWQADRDTLEPGHPVTFRWDNGQGVTFTVTASLDARYMFTLSQRVENRGKQDISLVPYAFINRAYEDSGLHVYILHEGPLGVLNGALSEIPYKTLREEGAQTFEDASGWLGVTDKYWLTAMIPGESGFRATVSHYAKNGKDRYQAEYTAPPVAVPAGAEAASTLRLFAGAKEIDALDAYAEGETGAPPVPLFDRAVDFGVLYFLTKPLFLLLNFFFAHTGNFGVAIILLTIVIKLLMFPVANKGYHATTQMRALQPEMQRIREQFAQDKMRLQQETFALYKREKVNPAAGCFPVLIQIPVFFALYKVLFVTIEMRHAPFLGWLTDLSARDPTNIFELFGLVPWDAPPFLHIGILPILMGVTMAIQMKQQPKPADPLQARIIGAMPYMLTFMLAPMPAGLVLYWTLSNVLSIIQQWVITRRYNAAHPKHRAV